MITIKSAIEKAILTLSSTSPSPRIDAEVLMAHMLRKSRTYLYSHSDERLNSAQDHTYFQLIEQRYQGKPIAYLTGIKEFWSLPIKVNEHTLIPRPATEKLVEVTLELLKHKPSANILDLGTGSGAIALALAKERPDWNISAADISDSALEIARKNAKNLGFTGIRFYQSNWFNNIPKQRYHAILSNPPYIPENDPHLKQGDLRYEPKNALISGRDGLKDIKEICNLSDSYLLVGGFLLIEHGYHQKNEIKSIMKQSGFTEIQCWQDCEGIDRVTGCIKKN